MCYEKYVEYSELVSKYEQWVRLRHTSLLPTIEWMGRRGSTLSTARP